MNVYTLKLTTNKFNNKAVSITWVAETPKKAMDEVRRLFWLQDHNNILFTEVSNGGKVIPMLEALGLE